MLSAEPHAQVAAPPEQPHPELARYVDVAASHVTDGPQRSQPAPRPVHAERADDWLDTETVLGR